jgi:hyaluronoglucosaminidase
VCPADYYGTPPFPSYLRELGRGLHPTIEIFYTGPKICSPTITQEDVVAFRDATGRKPVIWDNYPANDLQMRPELHVGPLLGRDARLPEGCAGYMANLMNQEEASKIPLLTTEAYLSHLGSYDPEAAWEGALREIGGAESFVPLRRFAENSLTSFLNPEPPVLDRLALDALLEVQRGVLVSESRAAAALATYLDELDESVYHLRNRMTNLALRQSLLPWIEALDDKLWLGRFALTALRTLQQHEDVRPARRRLHEQLIDVRRNPKRIGGTAILELAELAYTRVRGLHAGPESGMPGSQLLPVREDQSRDQSGYMAEGA